MAYRGASKKTLDMVGCKYGHLTILEVLPWKHQSGGARVLAQCACGDVRDYCAYRIREGVNQCRGCGRWASAETKRRSLSVRLPSGRTVGEVAAKHRLPLDTVYGRWRRGWPERSLGRPLVFGKRPGLGHATRVRPAITMGVR